MTWIYLSPHLDDAAYSCGGLIAQQTLQGETVEIWTICAGDPPPGPYSPFAEELHARWQAGEERIATRRREDFEACARLSATPHHLPVPDCIYRRADLDNNFWRKSGPAQVRRKAETTFLYPDREAIFAALQPREKGLVRRLGRELETKLPGDAELVCPLTLGGHVDHQLTRNAAESLGRQLWYYADFPYAMQHSEQIAALEASGWQRRWFPISQAALEAWIQAVAAYESQISTFWEDLSAMQAEIQSYHDRSEGAILWEKGKIMGYKLA